MSLVGDLAKKKNLKARDIREATGASAPTVHTWMRYDVGVSERYRAKLAECLDVPVSTLAAIGSPVGGWLAEARQHVGLNANQVAKRLGISGTAVRNYEAGRSRPKADHARAYAAVLHMSYEDFVAGIKLFGAVAPEKRSRNHYRPAFTSHEDCNGPRPSTALAAGRCADICSCLRWQCALCKQYWTGLPTEHECEKPSLH